MDKQQRNAVYRAFLQREGPTNLGSVEWPDAVPGALEGMNFLSTGVYDTITRDDLLGIITGSGGKVMSGMAKSLNYLLVGRDAGPSKLKTAEERGLTQLAEEECFNFFKEKFAEAIASGSQSTPTTPKRKKEEKPKVKKEESKVKKEEKPVVKKENESKVKKEKETKVKMESKVKKESDNSDVKDVKKKIKDIKPKVDPVDTDSEDDPIPKRKKKVTVKKETK